VQANKVAAEIAAEKEVKLVANTDEDPEKVCTSA